MTIKEVSKENIMLKYAILIVSFAMAVFHFGTAIHILDPILQRSLHLFFGLTLIFLIYPTSKKSNIKNWAIDIILLILGIASTLYISFNFEELGFPMRIAYPTLFDKILGVILVIVVLEATRRVIGPIMPTLAFIFISYSFFGPYLPGFLKSPGLSFNSFIGQGYLYVHGIFGTPLGVSATLVFIFILFGAMYKASGAENLFQGISMAFFGRLTGGPAKIAVVSSALFGTISGSSVANVATTGSFTIPLMKKVGYSKEFAGATEASASIGGQLMPPIMGASAFIIAEVLGIPYLEVVKAAIIPAILYFSSIFMSVDFYARKNKLKTLSKEELPNIFNVFKDTGILILPLLLLVYLFAFLRWYPTRVAFWTIVLTIIVGYIKKGKFNDLSWILDGAQEACKNALLPICACSCAGLIILSIQSTGLGLVIGQFLIKLSQSNLYLLLFFCMILSIILGMGLPTVAAYMIAAIVVAPSITRFGVLPIASHLFVFYFAIMSSITPPVALSAYTGAGIAGGDPTKTGFLSFGIALPSFLLAYRFVNNPSLLLQVNNIWNLMYQVVIVLLGFIAMISGSRAQFFNFNVGKIERIVFSISGIALILPNNLIGEFISLDFIGSIIFVIAVIRTILGNKKTNTIHNK